MTRVAVMRPPDKLEEAARVAGAIGLTPVCASPLRIERHRAPELTGLLQDLRRGRVGMLVLTSTTGVAALMGMLEGIVGKEELAALLRPVRTVAIGPLTAKAMEAAGLGTPFVPRVYSSEGLVAELERLDVRGMKAYVLRSDHGERALIAGLEGAGADVTEIVLYSLVPVPDSPDLHRLVEEMIGGGIDVFAFTSSLSAKAFIEYACRTNPRAEVVKALGQGLVAAVGLPTQRALEEEGIRVDVVPESATFEAMMQAVKKRIDRGGPGGPLTGPGHALDRAP